MSDETRLLKALLNGEDIGNFEPKSRMEAYLKNCCLASGIGGLPEPITETDALLYQLAEKLGTGGVGAKEPYIEETYDASGRLIDVNLVGYTAIRNNAFSNCPYLALHSLPSGLTSIGAHAFSNCKSLALTSLPSGLTSIGNHAFYNCTGLTSITFYGKPSLIDPNAFIGCTNLKTINVPWASGEVANAPWAATNATINYNYTG